METARHDSRDRLKIAALTGTASRHAARKTSGQYDRDAAIAELHTVSTDPHLLAHAICSPRHWQYRTLRAMLLEAGADEQDLDEVAAYIDERLRKAGFPVGELADDQE
ncbi:hypothetical protein Rhe02_55040 [Rhizocola hellebori]|uniref:Uncharacterized protein n=1 Tax=Rhizocola hellebori TaxID=1392758 RepID=A0A8J3VII5_9ACTN|nr:hypothetical protein [Rhizocola hellebori]GIH07437.1 hypothetical protein Rhe02_55040 [Rhizocola hellebori]